MLGMERAGLGPQWLDHITVTSCGLAGLTQRGPRTFIEWRSTRPTNSARKGTRDALVDNPWQAKYVALAVIWGSSFLLMKVALSAWRHCRSRPSGSTRAPWCS
jgi:hypothetical protein